MASLQWLSCRQCVAFHLSRGPLCMLRLKGSNFSMQISHVSSSVHCMLQTSLPGWSATRHTLLCTSSDETHGPQYMFSLCLKWPCMQGSQSVRDIMVVMTKGGRAQLRPRDIKALAPYRNETKLPGNCLKMYMMWIYVYLHMHDDSCPCSTPCFFHSFD